MSAEQIENGLIGSNIGELLTEDQLCALLQIKKTTAWKYRDRGELKFCRVGREVLYLREDVLDFLKRQRN